MVPCSALYGSLCLLSRLGHNSEQIGSFAAWIAKAQIWAMQKLQTIQAHRLGSLESVEAQVQCLGEILNKINQIFEKNPQVLGDAITRGLLF